MTQEMVAAYEVTVRGTFYSASGKDKMVRSFGPATFVLPERVTIPNGKKRIPKILPDGRKIEEVVQQYANRLTSDENIANYVVQRQLLPTWLAEKFPDASTFRTCEVVPGGIRRVMRPKDQVVELNKKIADMSYAELESFCAKKNLAVTPKMFSTVQEARETVKYEYELKYGNSPDFPAAAPKAPNSTGPLVEAADPAPNGVKASAGPVTSADDVPTDQEDTAAGFLR